MEEKEENKLCYYSPQQILLLLKMTGLVVTEQYGGCDKRPLAEKANEMIFVVKHHPTGKK